MQNFFQDAKKVTYTAIPIGFVGSMLAAVGTAIEASILLFIGIGLLMFSGIMWALHGVYEDKK